MCQSWNRDPRLRCSPSKILFTRSFIIFMAVTPIILCSLLFIIDIAIIDTRLVCAGDWEREARIEGRLVSRNHLHLPHLSGQTYLVVFNRLSEFQLSFYNFNQIFTILTKLHDNVLQKSKRKKILPPDARLPAFLTCLANLMTAHLQVVRMRKMTQIRMRLDMKMRMGRLTIEWGSISGREFEGDRE